MQEQEAQAYEYEVAQERVNVARNVPLSRASLGLLVLVDVVVWKSNTKYIIRISTASCGRKMQ